MLANKFEFFCLILYMLFYMVYLYFANVCVKPCKHDGMNDVLIASCSNTSYTDIYIFSISISITFKIKCKQSYKITCR